MIQQFHFEMFTQTKQNTNFKTYVHSNVHCSIIYNNQDMEALIDEWIKTRNQP